MSQRTEREVETTRWRQQETTLGRVSQGLDHFTGGIDLVRQEVQVVTTSQAAEATQMNQKLNAILEQILKLSLGRQQSSRAVELPDHGHLPPEEPMLGPCPDLIASITHLCALADKRQTTMALIEAKNVIKCLLAIISYMLSGDFMQGAVAASFLEAPPCGKCHRLHIEDVKACLSSVYSVLLSARHIAVNHQG